MPVIEPKNTSPAGPENCRTCVDFKSWAKQQRKSLTTTEVSFIRIVKFKNQFKFFNSEERCEKGRTRGSYTTG